MDILQSGNLCANAVDAELGARIDLTIDSGCAACALPVVVASAVGMQELSRTPQKYIAANAEKIRELGFKTATLKFQNGDVQNLKFSVVDKLHKPLVAARKVVAVGNRIVLQPENQGGSFIEDVRSKRRKRIFERNGGIRAPVLGRQTEFTETFGNLGQVVPKRPTAHLDVNAEESAPVRADEFDLVRVDEFGPTDSDEDVVQEAEELKHVPAPILAAKAEVESRNSSHLPLRSWCSACVRAEEFHLVIEKLTRKRRSPNRHRLSLWITGSLGNRKTEHTTHFQCSSCEIARVKASGVTRCRRRV